MPQAPPTVPGSIVAKRGGLPDPVWTSLTGLCVVCGYSLDGLAAPGRCPECGAPFDLRQLVVCGVFEGSRGGWTVRTWGWVGLSVSLFILIQCMVPMLAWSWEVTLALLLALVGGVIWMIASNKRERSGSERFVFSGAGIARLPLKQPTSGVKLDSAFVPWGNASVVELQKISPVWWKLRIGEPSGEAVTWVFKAGVRCPLEGADRLRGEIRALMESASAAPARDPLDGASG
jgi:hypothetical protein